MCCLCCLALTTVGCESSVDPIIGSPYPFTFWGFMNAASDTQLVRVFPISRELIPGPDQEIDAQVFSTDLTTGERRAWTYRQVRFDSLVAGHLFWAPFRAVHGHRYRLDVMRSDGASSWVEVTVPPPVTFEVDVQENATRVPVRITGDAPNLVGMRVTYYASNLPPQSVWPGDVPVHPIVFHAVTIPYDTLVQRDDEGWQVMINMRRDFEAVHAAYQAACLITDPSGSAPDIWLRALEFSILAADSSWAPPGGVFDPDRLAVPGTFSNVQHGYGFFGAGEGLRHRWVPSISARVLAGFNYQPRCTGTAQPVPACMNPPIPCLGGEVEDVWERWLR